MEFCYIKMEGSQWEKLEKKQIPFYTYRPLPR
jgi:hypothetical protein